MYLLIYRLCQQNLAVVFSRLCSPHLPALSTKCDVCGCANCHLPDFRRSPVRRFVGLVCGRLATCAACEDKLHGLFDRQKKSLSYQQFLGCAHAGCVEECRLIILLGGFAIFFAMFFSVKGVVRVRGLSSSVGFLD